MDLEPFLRRERIASVHSGKAFSDRRVAVVVVMAAVAGFAGLWDWQGWGRDSVAGAASFGLAVFGCIAAAQLVLAVAGPLTHIGPRIAAERDRKSLDALLTTRFTSAEIVLGTLAAGLLRYANGLAATLPVVALLVVLGGVDARLVMLAGVGVLATWYAMAAIAVAASATSRTRERATSLASALTFGWLSIPYIFVVVRPRLWPGCPAALTTAVLAMLRSSPTGVLANLLGIVRFGSPTDATLLMAACEVLGGSAVVAWAIWRLRPASRVAYDAEGQTARAQILRMVRAASRRVPRPPCGDDPVLWYAMHAARPTRAAWVYGQAINVACLGFLAVATSWFAGPAFQELASRGYVACSGAVSFPDPNPFVRVLVNHLNLGLSMSPAPGQARLEFNIALRQFSAMLASPFALGIAITAFRSVATERKSDTWLGLIATPLSSWEILRAKMLGAAWHARGYAVTMLALWSLGLAAGALHPLGFLAGLIGLATCTAFAAALGMTLAIWELRQAEDRNPRLWPVEMLTSSAGLILLTMGPILYTISSLLSYEDVHAAVHAGAPLPWSGWSGWWRPASARNVIVAWLLTTAALAVTACVLLRALDRGFDAAIGRPTRAPRAGDEAEVSDRS